jgi:hypothetical protein
LSWSWRKSLTRRRVPSRWSTIRHVRKSRSRWEARSAEALSIRWVETWELWLLRISRGWVGTRNLRLLWWLRLRWSLRGGSWARHALFHSSQQIVQVATVMCVTRKNKLHGFC